MKTVNGKNKLERQINKAKKFTGVTLEEKSNKYLKVTDAEEHVYIYFGDFADIETKYGRKIKFTPVNAQKDYWMNEWGTVQDKNYYDSFVIFKAYNDQLKQEFSELAKGADDVFELRNVGSCILVRKR
ncbi:MAG: hypothetical protein ACOC2U_05655 [bacterium]